MQARLLLQAKKKHTKAKGFPPSVHYQPKYSMDMIQILSNSELDNVHVPSRISPYKSDTFQPSVKAALPLRTAMQPVFYTQRFFCPLTLNPCNISILDSFSLINKGINITNKKSKYM